MASNIHSLSEKILGATEQERGKDERDVIGPAVWYMRCPNPSNGDIPRTSKILPLQFYLTMPH